MSKAIVSSCEHTLEALPPFPRGGSAVSFMNHIAGLGFFDGARRFDCTSEVELCFKSLVIFREVRAEDNERSLAIDLLLRFLRNAFVRDSISEGEIWFHRCRRNEAAIC